MTDEITSEDELYLTLKYQLDFRFAKGGVSLGTSPDKNLIEYLRSLGYVVVTVEFRTIFVSYKWCDGLMRDYDYLSCESYRFFSNLREYDRHTNRFANQTEVR